MLLKSLFIPYLSTLPYFIIWPLTSKPKISRRELDLSTDICKISQILFWSSRALEVKLVGFGYLLPSGLKRCSLSTFWVQYALAYGLDYHTKPFCNVAVTCASPNWPALCWKISGRLRACQSLATLLTHHSNRTGLWPLTGHMNAIITYACHSGEMISPRPFGKLRQDPNVTSILH